MNASEQRLCSRINLTRSVILTLDNGNVIHATTDDLSLGGVKVFTLEDVTDCTGQTAELQIKLHDDQLSKVFNCEIVSCESKLLRLKLDRKQATTFGMLIAKGALLQVDKTA